jgi:hypothetical protein
MIRNDDSVDRQMLLAEFTALRAEILHNSNLAWNIFALQVTAAGIIFSFALGNRNHIGFLLILPVITYAFSGRYIGQIVDIVKIGTYIREVLEVKTKGDLHWEEWTRSRPSRLGTLTLLNPLFPGVGVELGDEDLIRFQNLMASLLAVDQEGTSLLGGPADANGRRHRVRMTGLEGVMYRPVMPADLGLC